MDAYQILMAIQQDQVALFSTLVGDCVDVSLGRFPLLSLCYLYNANKIIDKYKSVLRKINIYNRIDEPVEIYQKFKPLAGKAMRLYLKENAVVSPLEMLAILHKDKYIKKQYLLFEKTDKIINNIKTIYSINSQHAEGDSFYISIPSAPISYSCKRTYKLSMILSIIFVVFVLAMGSVVGVTTGFGVSWSSSKIYNEKQLLSALLNNAHCILMSDIEIDSMYINSDFGGVVNGNNHRLIVKNTINNYLLKSLSGEIFDLKIEYSDSSITTSNSISLLLANNSGVIKNVDVVCNKFLVTANKNDKDIFVSGFATNNSGIIENCNLSIDMNVNALDDGECYVSAFVGKNSGMVKNCSLSSNSILSTNDADVSGLVALNELTGVVKDCKNHAKISQVSNQAGWSPNVGGIVLTNYGTIENSHNLNSLSVSSDYLSYASNSSVFLGGIATMNFGQIVGCVNNGNLTAKSKKLIVYCGGVTAYSTYSTNDNGTIKLSSIIDCGARSVMDVTNEDIESFVFVGGLSGYLYGQIKNCYSLSQYVNGYNEDGCFVGLALGATNIDYQIFGGYYMCIDAQSNDVLFQDNVSYHIGALINGNSIVSTGVNADSDDISIAVSADVIDEKEVGSDAR